MRERLIEFFKTLPERIRSSYADDCPYSYPGTMVGPNSAEEEEHPTPMQMFSNRRDPFARDEFEDLAHAYSVISDVWRSLKCAVLSHKLIDDGYGGPDSGCIHVHCLRCGWDAGETWLY